MDGNGHANEAIRSTWTLEEVRALYRLPFDDLMYRAQSVHRAHFDPNAVQLSTLLSIKTGGCPEDCAYCPQSVRYDTGVEREALMALGRRRRARARRARGAARRASAWAPRGAARRTATSSRSPTMVARRRARSASRPAPRSAC